MSSRISYNHILALGQICFRAPGCGRSLLIARVLLRAAVTERETKGQGREVAVGERHTESQEVAVHSSGKEVWVGSALAMASLESNPGQAFGQPRYAYTILYVRDVAKSVEFYSKTFGFRIRRLDHSERWGELETGSTTVAFTRLEQHETDITGGVETPSKEGPRPNLELSFSFDDVDAAYKHAVGSGALSVAEPEAKEWGQKVGYVRDLDGVVIRLGSHVHEHLGKNV